MQMSDLAPLACVPIVAADAAEVLRQAEAIRVHEPRPDVVELRADHLRGLTSAQVMDALAEARSLLSNMPFLFTNRRAAEGGAWEGTESARIDLIQAAIDSKQVLLVDVELATDARIRTEMQQQMHGVIVSAHDFAKTPDDDELDRLLAELVAAGGNAAKLAVTAQTPDDALRLLRATARMAATSPVSLITMAMGAAGSITRLAGPFFGSTLTFATVGPSSAPGQMPLTLVRDYWRAVGLRG